MEVEYIKHQFKTDIVLSAVRLYLLITHKTESRDAQT